MSNIVVPRIVLVVALASIPFSSGSAVAQEEAPCVMCHGTASNFAGQPDSASLVVTEESFEASVHGEVGMPCTSCHAGLKFPHPSDPPVVNCSACHSGIAEQYESSLHGYALSRGNTAAPTCIDCHGVHDILHSTDPNSKASHANTARLCAECHNPHASVVYDDETPGEGVSTTTNCTSCHVDGSHADGNLGVSGRSQWACSRKRAALGATPRELCFQA